MAELTKEQQALGMFNTFVHSYSMKESLLAVRMNALFQLAQNKSMLHSLAQYFKARMPHWRFLNGNDYQTCKYNITRLSSSETEFYRSPWGEQFVKVKIHVDPGKYAYVKKERKSINGSCRIHPNKQGVAHGLCSTCYTRFRTLKHRGMISARTPESVVDMILNLPTLKGRGCFIWAVEDILNKQVMN